MRNVKFKVCKAVCGVTTWSMVTLTLLSVVVGYFGNDHSLYNIIPGGLAGTYFSKMASKTLEEMESKPVSS